MIDAVVILNLLIKLLVAPIPVVPFIIGWRLNPLRKAVWWSVLLATVLNVPAVVYCGSFYPCLGPPRAMQFAFALNEIQNAFWWAFLSIVPAAVGALAGRNTRLMIKGEPA